MPVPVLGRGLAPTGETGGRGRGEDPGDVGLLDPPEERRENSVPEERGGEDIEDCKGGDEG